MKDSASLEKALAGDRDCSTAKEILGWVINTYQDTLALYSKQRLELLSLLTIPPTHCRISVKKLERLINKLRSIHLAIPGDIGHSYPMQVALTRARAAKNATANHSARFHQDIKFCRSLCAKITTRPTYLAKLFQSRLHRRLRTGRRGGGLDRPQ